MRLTPGLRLGPYEVLSVLGVSEATFTIPIFFVSPDGQWLATPDPGVNPVLISLKDGKVTPVPGVEGRAFPRGWGPDGSLWLRVSPRSSPAPAVMLRLDVRSGRVLQKQILGPVDPTGVTLVGNILVAPDGKGFVFSYRRELGSLFIVSGLNPTKR